MSVPELKTVRPLGELERRLVDLPLLPSVITEVLSLNSDADDYSDRILRLAERDPPFAVRVLRCANSAYSAPIAPIVSLSHAVMRLGAQRCAGLVLALAVAKVFVPRAAAQRFLWVHSLQTAAFARMFCQRRQGGQAKADRAYVCGLLHDIGRFVQFEGASADLARVDDTHWESPQELVDAERAVLGYDHATLGWHACRKWALPESIGEVIRYHHHRGERVGEEPDSLLRVVQWADELSVVVCQHPDLGTATDEEFVRRLATEFPTVGPPPGTDQDFQWRRAVPGVYAESMRLAQELQLV